MKQQESRPSVRILSQYFYPEAAAVGQFMTELAEALRDRGFAISVLTSRAAYQSNRLLPGNEVYRGISIRRPWSTNFNKQNLLGRICNLATFFVSVTLELIRTRNRSELLLVSNAPLLGVIGLASYVLTGRNYICVIEDVYPDLVVRLGLFSETSLIVRGWTLLNRTVYSHAKSLVVLGKRMEAVVRRRLPDDFRPPIFIIPSWADGETVRPLPKEANDFAKAQDLLDKFVVLYSGNLGLAHDLETIVLAADRLREDNRFLFLFIGEGGKKKQLIEQVKKLNLNNVRFLPYQPRENLPYSLTCGDVSIVTMERGVEGLVIPSKIYGCLAAGQAVIALVGRETEIADIVHDHQCGIHVSPGDVNQFIAAILNLAQDKEMLNSLQKNSRKCFTEHFTKDKAIELFISVIHHSQPPPKP